MTVTNKHGVEIDFATSVELMDSKLLDYIRITYDMAELREQEYFDIYCKLHEAINNEQFELSKQNPVY